MYNLFSVSLTPYIRDNLSIGDYIETTVRCGRKTIKRKYQIMGIDKIKNLVYLYV